MKQLPNQANTQKNDLYVGQELEGFKVEQITPLPELRATAVLAAHARSGARILHVLAPWDPENCFAITFPTPPPDDTGVSHILEHVVLGGSRKFPLNNPFFEMMKMSMATSIGASTHQSYTVYPVTSNVKKDFFNLAEVYLDAVLDPRLTEDIFHREGHHLTLENNSDLSSPLKVSGIVYNEMKGVSSMPEHLMQQLVRRGLFPDTPLSRSSGGTPDRIPDLTYEQLLCFHRELYHPSNGLFFIYGDIPTIEHLSFLAPVLKGFERRDVHLSTLRQPRWAKPRCIEENYPIGSNEDIVLRTFLTLNWIIGDALDPLLVTDWKLLSILLFGNDSAPLKKALIDSKMGTNVFYLGSRHHSYEEVFHIGLKGSEPDRGDAFEHLVLSALERLADEPFSSERIEAAFQQLAYNTLEVKTLFPLYRLSEVNAAWPFNGDPLTFLCASEHLDACHECYVADTQRFNRLICDGLLKNPHRLRVVLRPDRDAQTHADAAFAMRMSEQRDRFSAEQIAKIAKSADALAAAQVVPNSPEALATLPQLKTTDLPIKPRRIPTESGHIAGVTVLRNDVFANGVNYLQINMDLAGLPVELYRWLQLFTETLSRMGAAGQDFARIAERRDACTGGLWLGPHVWRHAIDPDNTLRGYSFGFKTLDKQAKNALDLLGDLIFAADPHDHDRLRDVMTQVCASYRTVLINKGGETACHQAVRGLSPAAAISHLFFSPDFLRFIQDLNNNFDQRADEIIRNVEHIRDFLAKRARWTISFTGSDAVFRTLGQTLESWFLHRSNEPIADELLPFHPYNGQPREGLAGPMKIAYCVKSTPAPHLNHPDVPLFMLGVHLAGYDYLLPEIRFKRNAYGVDTWFDGSLGVFNLRSSRDPNIVETLDVFDGLRNYVASQHWSQIDIDRVIIGSTKDVEAPIRPSDATGTALKRHIRGTSDEMREMQYAATLEATPESVKETMLRVLDANEPRSSICVVSSREKINEANERLGNKRLTVSEILP